jgi:EmrB/QacA subfamily drug resistance transporter
MLTLDNTILNVAMPTLVRALGASSGQLQWTVDAYAMVFAGLMLVGGSLADRFGRKRMFLLGLAGFATTSAWAAFSGSAHMLIAARSAMGASAAIMMPASLSIVTDMFRVPAERQRAIGAWAAMNGLGIALGPVIGGLLLTHFWWGSVFLVNVPAALLGLVLAIPLVPESKNLDALRPDPLGGLLSIAGLGLLLWAIIEAPARGWLAGPIIGTALAGLAALAAFVAWELAIDHPMLNLDFFRRRQFSAATSSMALALFALLGAMFVLTQFLQFELGLSPIQAGLRILPVAGVLVVAAPLSASAVRAVGAKLTAAAGLAAVAAGLWWLSSASVASTYSSTLGGMILLGLGAGLVIPTVTDSFMGSLPPSEFGVGSATASVSIQVGGALGVAVIGSVLSGRYQAHLKPPLAIYHLPQDVSNAALGSIGGAQQVASHLGAAVGSRIAELARSAFMSGMDLALLVAAAVSVASIVLAMALLPGRQPAAPGPQPAVPEPDPRPAHPSQQQG